MGPLPTVSSWRDRAEMDEERSSRDPPRCLEMEEAGIGHYLSRHLPGLPYHGAGGGQSTGLRDWTCSAA